MAYLTVMSGAMGGQRFDLENPVTRIGRREGNDWIIQDGSVSGTHCEIEKTKTGFILRDLGSTNGTRINGAAIEAAYLNPGDHFQFGNIEGVYEPQAQNAPLPAPAAPGRMATGLEAGGAPPSDFGNASPFSSKRVQKDPMQKVALAVGAVAILIAILVTLFGLTISAPTFHF